MLSRALATLVALLLACACPQASAYVRAERVADADDHLTRYTDARGFVHDYTIDALGRKTGEADPTVSGPGGGSFRQSWAYDTQDNVLRVEDRLGIADTYSYDRENRLLSRSRDGERKLTQTYDLQGNLLTQSDANGQITRFEYDAANRRTLTLRPEGIREALTYTADDDVATRTDALSRVWRNGYDVRRRLRSERNPAADELTEHEYDNANNRVLTRRPLLQTWAYAYDGADRLRAVTSPLTWQTTYRYDLAGNRIEEKNARGHTITQTFDVLNRRSTRALDANAVQLWTYDGANNLIREETPNGAQIDSSYDELNRRVSRLLQGSAAPGAWSGSRFSYDANGKVLTESTEVAGLAAWTRTRQYDRQERLVFERDGDGATLATTYDPQNNRLTLTDSAGDLTRYTYDHANRLTSVAAPAIGTTEYRYNTASQLIERTGQGGYSSVTAYDPAGRVQRIEHRIGGTPTLTLEYDYDRNGNRAEQRLTHAGSGLERTSYAYDNADRLTRSTRTPPSGNALETTWTLDAVGNRTLEEVRELGSLTQRTAYSYDLRDRLQTATPELPTGPPTAYQYDADGNVSSEQIGSAAPTQYRWDARDRLAEYTPAGAPAIRNRYDESDRRIAREDAATGSRYRWDGNAVIEETNALGNRLTRYHRGMGLIGATSATTQPDPRQYASDAQDTPLALIRPDGGIAGRASFDIWGKSTSQSGEQSKLGFTGYQKETGDLYQAVARYYRPGTGSFLSTDPWEGDYNNPVSLNKYLYGYGNPGIFVDPDGRISMSPEAAIAYAASLMPDPQKRENFLKNATAYQHERDVATAGDFRALGRITAATAEGTINLADAVIFGGPKLNDLTPEYLAEVEEEHQAILHPRAAIVEALEYAARIKATDPVEARAIRSQLVMTGALAVLSAPSAARATTALLRTLKPKGRNIPLRIGDARPVSILESNDGAPNLELNGADTQASTSLKVPIATEYVAGEVPSVAFNRRAHYGGSATNSPAGQAARAAGEGQPCATCGQTQTSGTNTAPWPEHEPSLVEHYYEHGGWKMTREQARAYANSSEALNGTRCATCQRASGASLAKYSKMIKKALGLE